MHSIVTTLEKLSSRWRLQTLVQQMDTLIDQDAMEHSRSSFDENFKTKLKVIVFEHARSNFVEKMKDHIKG